MVGEILVKFLPAANNYVVDLLESEGAEAVVPDLTDFLLYCCYNTNFKADYLGASKKAKFMNNRLIAFFEWLRKDARDELAKSKHFEPTAHVQDLAEYASPIVSCGNQTGEGWFLCLSSSMRASQTSSVHSLLHAYRTILWVREL